MASKFCLSFGPSLENCSTVLSWSGALTLSSRLFFLKPSIVRELMLLDDDSLLEKLPLVKADENEEAAPLPVKVHIDATTL